MGDQLHKRRGRAFHHKKRGKRSLPQGRAGGRSSTKERETFPHSKGRGKKKIPQRINKIALPEYGKRGPGQFGEKRIHLSDITRKLTKEINFWRGSTTPHKKGCTFCTPGQRSGRIPLRFLIKGESFSPQQRAKPAAFGEKPLSAL